MQTTTLEYSEKHQVGTRLVNARDQRNARIYTDFHRLMERLDAGLALLHPDPPSWRSLMARSVNGDKRAYRVLLSEFQEFLEMYFARQATDILAVQLVDATLHTAHAKLHTCDPNAPILPWLLALADYRAGHMDGATTHH